MRCAQSARKSTRNGRDKESLSMSKIQKGEFPYGHFFRMISGKWKPYILVAIDYEESIRFNQILKFWGEISSKVLYQNLRELEEDQLIQRFSDPDVKQHVEYRLTENGKRVMPIIKEIYKYSIDDMINKDILIDSRAFDYYNPSRRKREAEQLQKDKDKAKDAESGQNGQNGQNSQSGQNGQNDQNGRQRSDCEKSEEREERSEFQDSRQKIGA